MTVLVSTILCCTFPFTVKAQSIFSTQSQFVSINESFSITRCGKKCTFRRIQMGSKTLLERAEEDIKRLEETKQSTIRVEEEKAMYQVCEQMSALALSKAVTQVKTRLAKDSSLQRRLLDLNIALLGRIASK